MEKPIKPDLNKYITPDHRRDPHFPKLLDSLSAVMDQTASHSGKIGSATGQYKTDISKVVFKQGELLPNRYPELLSVANQYIAEVNAYNKYLSMTDPDKLFTAAVQILAGYRAGGQSVASPSWARRAIEDARQIALELCTIEVDK